LGLLYGGLFMGPLKSDFSNDAHEILVPIH